MFVTLHSDYGRPTVDSWNVVIVSRDCGSDILKEKTHCVIRGHKQTQQTELRVCVMCVQSGVKTCQLNSPNTKHALLQHVCILFFSLG